VFDLVLEIFIIPLFAQASYYVLFCSGKTAIVFRSVLLRDLQMVVVVVDWLALDGLFVDCGLFCAESVILQFFYIFLQSKQY